MTYEMRVWNARIRCTTRREGAAVYGDDGYVVIGNSRWRAFDAKGKLIKEEEGELQRRRGPRAELPRLHAQPRQADRRPGNGRPSVEPALPPRQRRLARRPHAAVRPGTYTFTGDADANQFLTRPEYRKPWVLPKLSEV